MGSKKKLKKKCCHKYEKKGRYCKGCPCNDPERGCCTLIREPKKQQRK